MENKYRLDRNKVSALSFAEADDHLSYWLNKSEDERLNAACAIINQIFGVTANTRVNRTVVDKRKHA
jgi:hypothetical protein